MKLICLQENLNKGLFLVSHLASKNITLPILNNVLLKAEKGLLNLITTNLEIGIQAKVRGKIEKEGSFTLPAQLFFNYINLLPLKQIEIELLENEYLSIKCENHKTKIKGTSNEEFPLIPKIEKVNKFLLKGKELKNALSKVIYCISSEESRIELNGLLFSFENEKLVLVGTDSYRLGEIKVNLISKENREQKIIVPKNTLVELLRILEDEDLEIYISENQILFSLKDIELTSRIISGSYPDYRQIIPKTFRTKAVFDNNNFIKIIKSAALFSQSELNGVTLTLLKDKIIISSLSSQYGEYISEIKAEIEGEENKIVFNHRYLLEGLLNLNNNEGVLEVINDENPAILKPSSLDHLYLIMPIKE